MFLTVEIKKIVNQIFIKNTYILQLYNFKLEKLLQLLYELFFLIE